MAVIKQLIDNDTGTQIYPITTTTAVLDNDSNTLLSLLDDKANADDMFIVLNASTLTKSILIRPGEYADLSLIILLKLSVDLNENLVIEDTNGNTVEQSVVLRLLQNNLNLLIFSYQSYNEEDYFLTKCYEHESVSNRILEYGFSGVSYAHTLYLTLIYKLDTDELYIDETYETSREELTPYSSNPLMDGTAASGTSKYYSRGDHRHPSDTSRVPTSRTINGKALSSDITLTASDVGALPASTNIPGVGTLNTNNSTALITNSSESFSNNINLHKISKTGSYNDILDKPTIPAAATSTPLMDGIADVGSSSKYAKEDHVHPSDTSRVPTSRKINDKPLSTDITLTANDVGAATISDVNTAISNLVDSAPTTLNTLNELATALGNDPNFATTITNKIAALQVHVGSVAGKLYRDDVNGGGNFTVRGNSGCIPNLTAGTFLVSIYAKSATQSYTFKFNFGSVSYNLSTTNGEINDVREITIPSNGTFSGSVLNGSVAAGTILYVVMYDYLTPISTVGPAAVTNRYDDLDGIPTFKTVGGTNIIGSGNIPLPTVNNGTLTIQRNGTTVGTFTANQSSNTTANITVPTTASDVGADVFVVNIESDDNDGYTHDKTNAEIYAAWQAGKYIVCAYNGYYFPLSEVSQTMCSATGFTDEAFRYHILITATFGVLIHGGYLQEQLINGNNIKTISNQSLLGSGNLTASDIGAVTGFVVDFTLSGTTISNPNKTFSEIKAACDAGNLVLARDDANSLYYLLYCVDTGCGFFCCDSGTLYGINVDSSDTWTYLETNISQLELDLSDKSLIIYMQKVNNVWKKLSYNSSTGAWLVDNTTLTTGNTKNIYLDKDNNDLYYWNGSAFTLLSEDKVLSDWNLTDNTKVDYIKNKPSIPTTASDINAMSTSHAANTITSNDINNWNSKADVVTLVTVSGTGSVTLALDANKFYKFGTLTSLTLTLNSVSNGLGIYAGKFTASSTGCTLSIPASVTESIDNPDIMANGTYEFNIMDNILLMVQI